ncbi:hypothetical protein POPTR_005G030901v4 [Populus trichocarpa]|uniref:Uncharacterized protein n=1 Tax=Populus trichocarpa TaxID=3694 RepID=A0A3N7EW01_POPTR|nr:hypothetical protein POPTR_005G030901v4 [Populus trichocarpa]
MLRWPYLLNPPLDHSDFWIRCSPYTPLLTDRSDCKEHNPFDINHHLEFPGKQKGNAPVGQFGPRPIFLSRPPLDHAQFWICGEPRCYLNSGRLRSETISPARFRAC